MDTSHPTSSHLSSIAFRHNEFDGRRTETNINFFEICIKIKARSLNLWQLFKRGVFLQNWILKLTDSCATTFLKLIRLLREAETPPNLRNNKQSRYNKRQSTSLPKLVHEFWSNLLNSDIRRYKVFWLMRYIRDCFWS